MRSPSRASTHTSASHLRSRPCSLRARTPRHACSHPPLPVQATDSQGTTTRDPPYATPKDRRYYGTIVADPADSSSLFVLEL